MSVSLNENKMTSLNRLMADISSYSSKIQSRGSEKNEKTQGNSFISLPPREFEAKAVYLDGGLAFSAQKLASSADYYKFSRPARSYAIGSYGLAAGAGKEEMVRIGFVHEYNRNFDFKI